jgi:hypothetical protein
MSGLVLSALAYKQRSFEVFRWPEDNFNDSVAQQLCSLIDVPLHTISCTADEIENFKSDVFVYSEGSTLEGWNFAALAKECAKRGREHLLLGFSGDVISGSLTVPEPEHFHNIADLAKYALRSQMELLSFESARDLLNDVSLDVIEKTKIEWEASFTAEAWRETLSDIAIWQRLANRNLKRVRNAMMPGLQYAQLIFPYLDSAVLDSYFSAPIELIQYQRAHCYAGFYRFEQFGNYQATSFPLSLKSEMRLPIMLHSARTVREFIQNLRWRFHYDHCFDWNVGRRLYAQKLCNSPVFNRKQLEKLFSKNSVHGRSLNKMYNLAKVFDFYVS